MSTWLNCVASTSAQSVSSASSALSATPLGSVARSKSRLSCTRGPSGCELKASGAWRAKERIFCTRLRARRPALWICARLCAAAWSVGSSWRANATLPNIAPMMLLKSCAMVLARVPTASIFCDSRNCASSSVRAASASLRALMSLCMPVMRSGLPSVSRATTMPRSSTHFQRPSLQRMRNSLLNALTLPSRQAWLSAITRS